MSTAKGPSPTTNAEIIPVHLALKAMRDSGYRNTAYALAEIIDNAVQADATDIEVYCLEEKVRIAERMGRRITTIATLDNGKGMTPDVLCLALQFGNGMHLNDRSGIGRFGMGLPNSSISQCRRLDVWTWRSGPDNAVHSYLDVDEIEAGKLSTVPTPTPNPLPSEWRKRSSTIGTTGTLVVWSSFDEHRLTWKSARSTLDNTETIVGRMYRKFVDRGELRISLIAYEDAEHSSTREVRVNDPLYLMKNSSTPVPFDKEPMFQSWGPDEIFPIEWNGAKHNVHVRLSYAKPTTVTDDGLDRGRKPYGKHAMRNIGVSILRAGRELDLDSNWAIGYDPVERWWGAEVEFPPALDEVFGVPNNKQAATIFSQMSHFDWEAEAEPNEKYDEVKQRLRDSGDHRAELMQIADYITAQLKSIRDRLKDQTKGSRRGQQRRHDEPTVEDRASSKFKERAEHGHSTDHDKQVFDAPAKSDLVQDLLQKHYPAQAARQIAESVAQRGKRVIFIEAAMDGFAFFKVEQRPGGVTEIVFNTQHPAINQLVKTLDVNVEDLSDREILERLENASDTLKMLFAAWARYEIEDVPNKKRIEEMRHDWGRMARVFLEDDDA